jgi:DNA primase
MIVLLFDSDVAGAAASSRALQICLEEGIDIKLAFVPQGKDPCDFLLAAGADKLREIIANAADVMDFKWNQLKQSLQDGDTLTQKTAATREFIHTLAAALRAGKLDRITRGLILNRVSSLTGLSPRQLEDEINAQIGALNRSASYRTENSKVVSIDLGDGWFAKAQKEIVEVLLNDPTLIPLAAERISAESFDIPVLGQIAGILFEEAGRGENLSIAEILSRVESTDTAAIVVQLQQEGEKKGNYRARLVDAVRAVLDGRKAAAPIAVADDETERLKSISARGGKTDLRRTGMK